MRNRRSVWIPALLAACACTSEVETGDLPVGRFCAENRECASGVCAPFQGGSCTERCRADADCGGPGLSGQCIDDFCVPVCTDRRGLLTDSVCVDGRSVRCAEGPPERFCEECELSRTDLCPGEQCIEGVGCAPLSFVDEACDAAGDSGADSGGQAEFGSPRDGGGDNGTGSDLDDARDEGPPDSGEPDLGAPPPPAPGYRRHPVGGTCFYDEALDPSTAVTLSLAPCDAARWPVDVCSVLSFDLSDGAVAALLDVTGRGQTSVRPVGVFGLGAGRGFLFLELDDTANPPRVARALRLPDFSAFECNIAAWGSGDGASVVSVVDLTTAYLLHARHGAPSFGDAIASLPVRRDRESMRILGVDADRVVHRFIRDRRVDIVSEDAPGVWSAAGSMDVGNVMRVASDETALLAWIFRQGLVRLDLDPLRVGAELYENSGDNGSWSTDGRHHIWLEETPGGRFASFVGRACDSGICDEARLEPGRDHEARGETNLRGGLGVVYTESPEVFRLQHLPTGRTGELRAPIPVRRLVPVLTAEHAYLLQDDDGRSGNGNEHLVRVAYETGLAPGP